MDVNLQIVAGIQLALLAIITICYVVVQCGAAVAHWWLATPRDRHLPLSQLEAWHWNWDPIDASRSNISPEMNWVRYRHRYTGRTIRVMCPCKPHHQPKEANHERRPQ